jgi:serine/threonine protein kinase
LCPRLSGNAFDTWFLPILIQCVLLIGTLEEAVGINHRDLKGDNILISKSGDLQEREVELCGRRWLFTFRRSVHVVDFGFSCRGSKMDGRASVSAGDFFTLTDLCPKQGRDIYVLLCYFWAQPHWRSSASPKLLSLVRDFLRAQKILDHLEVHGLSRTKYIYFLLSDPDFPCTCTPTAILESIAATWPGMLAAR